MIIVNNHDPDIQEAQLVKAQALRPRPVFSPLLTAMETSR